MDLTGNCKLYNIQRHMLNVREKCTLDDVED